jgi:nucleotide-binding universal stress UspA family protein
MSGTVLVAYDFGDIGDRVLAWAREHARAHALPVTLLHTVVLVPPPVAPDGVIAPATPTVEDVQEVQQRLREIASRANVDASCEVMVSTNVGDTVVQRAKDLTASLVVIGTHARGPIARAVIGSVADYVVRHAPCPVVTIR